MGASRQLRVRGQRGFTMVELLVTVAILAIIAALAAPSFRTLMLSRSLTAASHEIVGALQLARMEALRRRASVTVCPSANGTACSGIDWKRFVVLRGNEVLRDVTLRAGDYTVRSEGNRTITFTASGFINQAGWVASCAPGLSKDNRVAVEFGVSRISTRRTTLAGCQS